MNHNSFLTHLFHFPVHNDLSTVPVLPTVLRKWLSLHKERFS